jgi:PST family polysaccharide transporter
MDFKNAKQMIPIPNKKLLFSVYYSLYSVQAAKCIFPLITIYYLVRVIGPEKLRLTSFPEAFVQHLDLFTDGGVRHYPVMYSSNLRRNNVRCIIHRSKIVKGPIIWRRSQGYCRK